MIYIHACNGDKCMNDNYIEILDTLIENEEKSSENKYNEENDSSLSLNEKERFVKGYRLIYRPEYKNSYQSGNHKGWIYEHRYVMEMSIGRELNEHEVVHHLDCNKRNNSISNLIILTQASHAKLHMWIDRGAYIDPAYLEEIKHKNKEQKESKYCLTCSAQLQYKQKKYCSIECASDLETGFNAITRKATNPQYIKPSLEQLLRDKKEMNFVQLGKKYGVSDNAVRKWFKNYGLDPKNF